MSSQCLIKSAVFMLQTLCPNPYSVWTASSSSLTSLISVKPSTECLFACRRLPARPVTILTSLVMKQLDRMVEFQYRHVRWQVHIPSYILAAAKMERTYRCFDEAKDAMEDADTHEVNVERRADIASSSGGPDAGAGGAIALTAGINHSGAPPNPAPKTKAKAKAKAKTPDQAAKAATRWNKVVCIHQVRCT